MQIKILNVNAVETRQGPKKSYKVFTLNYAVDQKSQDKNIMEFSPVFKILAAAQPGESYEIESQKNSAGYVDWLSAKKVEGEATGATATGASVPNTYVKAPDPRETPEERAAKQVSIVRQSCLKNAIDYLKGEDGVTTALVLEVAQSFVNWVGQTVTADDFQDDVIE